MLCESHVIHRVPKNGSWFIYSICKDGVYDLLYLKCEFKLIDAGDKCDIYPTFRSYSNFIVNTMDGKNNNLRAEDMHITVCTLAAFGV